ncbi:MAG: TAXI family TRAP transporter solute-binding subunit [Gammaproteobacteria bacterium]|nr:TAXI family TRAP transporter solute-binding subunit [Gammaproteobacteria bacterium]NIM71888.1 TAXI family TRAP transporter solute-binding subunit [Gammaproteobacteria bacterium]NIN38010.1 TAXI family TRAP transporter solute-binding subunit [Gammaproteobacteria bacterium]NIO23644.1 TAXI family TRAP transporter solute-binding subunit [Gammaproteobacteria bacterium]NIO64260.1 TAXI family TRAP transporter solute-binding subunit [Gammaproteobacteria bacterium]
MGKLAIPRGALVALILAVAVVPPRASAADLVIGAGTTAQVHTSVGRAICRLIRNATPGTTCEVAEVEGRHAAEPLAVLSGVRNNAIEIGIVQSDWQFHAFQGSGPVEFMDVRFDNLRSLFSLHGELFTVIARRDSGIETLDDLAGKRINIGNPGSSQRVIMDMVMNSKGWTRKSFQFTDELSDGEQLLALCHNRVQAVVSVVSHPNERISKALELCDAEIVPVSGVEIDKLVANSRFLAASEVTMGVYGEHGELIPTFGVMVTAVTSSDLDEETAYSVVKTVFDNLGSMKRLHRALGNLLPGRMITSGLSAPLHPGAARYYREKGMI